MSMLFLPGIAVIAVSLFGIGGVPRRPLLKFLVRSARKTTLAQRIVAEMQKLGGIAAFVDAEHALDPDYASKMSQYPMSY